MAAIDTTHTYTRSANVFLSLAHMVSNAVATWRGKNRTYAELSKLSDRELDDIGLCRGDIRVLVGNL